ncbi:MAG: hypothetical protein MI754_00665 [Chromatiales bacterium]|nr:hypothetical protein [Chromatiales bacterium]
MLKFSQWPGRRERHLIRRQDNPLFPDKARTITQQALTEAQRLDHEEIVEFIPHFRTLIQQAVTLQPNVESDVILKLKEELDKSYEQACGLADDQTETKQAIKKLIAVIMGAVEGGAKNDPVALDELEQERLARDTHFQLLENRLVADLLYPEQVIPEQELIATLFSVTDEEFGAAITLFDQPQLEALSEQAQAAITQWQNADVDTRQAEQRLVDMNSLLRALSGELSQ